MHCVRAKCDIVYFLKNKLTVFLDYTNVCLRSNNKQLLRSARRLARRTERKLRSFTR